MLHTRFKAESPVLKVGSCHGTQLKVTGLSALSRKPNLDKLAACRAPTGKERCAELVFAGGLFRSSVLVARGHGDDDILALLAVGFRDTQDELVFVDAELRGF